jgi:DNA-binding IclR family transcriptional regulator
MADTMEYESPPVERAIRVLAHLADTPRARLSLSDISRGAEVSKATCLRILSSLVRHGYVTEHRDEATGDRSYGLGPTLIGLGLAAQSSFASVGLARPRMAALSEELGVACTASAVIDGDMVVLERTGPPTPLDMTIAVGKRYRFAPPSGITYVVWTDRETVDAWLADHRYSSITPDRADLDQLIESCRRTGYIVEQLSDAYASMSTLVSEWKDEDLPPAVRAYVERTTSTLVERHYLDSAIVPGGEYPVRVICSVSYDANGRPDLLLGLLVLRTLSHDDVRRYGEALAAAADAVTADVGGRSPRRDAADV